MLLEGKNAVIYGGGGSIGSAVATAFAHEGATVFLAGRTQAKLDKVADEIRNAGGTAHTAQLDALDERAVDEHADNVATRAGSLDIAFNLIKYDYEQGTPIVEMAIGDYLDPVARTIRSTFLTWRAAARHMTKQGGGVILAFGGEGDPPRGYHLGSLQVGFHAVEAMRRQMSAEYGDRGIRVVTLRTGGVPESIPQSMAARDRIATSIANSTMLGRAATLDDVGRVAAFVASDHARTMTAATVNISAGALID